METTEGKAKLEIAEGVFFNPHMELCRTVASLWVGTLPDGIEACDGFCASGARGIRYAAENSNIGKITFVDMSAKACANAKKNVAKNRLGKRAKVVKEEIRKFLLSPEISFNLIELDPFGTPVPFLPDVMRCGDKRVVKYLSVTATDMAVLCGAHHAACVKNYQSRPLNNEFCHENAIRILLGKIAREAAQENYGMEVEFSLSHRHYVKVFVRLEPSAEKAVESAKLAFMHVSYCHECGWRELGGYPVPKCKSCGKRTVYGGQMWGGKLWERAKVEKMLALLAERDYLGEGGKVAQKLLATVLSEADGEPFYYDLHEMASRRKMGIAGVEKAIERLKKEGFAASRTHFATTAIRTNATAGQIEAAMKKLTAGKE